MRGRPASASSGASATSGRFVGGSFRGRMPVGGSLVQVSYIKRDDVKKSGVEGLGGVWRDRPWYMFECKVIWEIGRTDSERQWNFFVVIDSANVAIAVAALGGDQHLVAAGKPLVHFKNGLAMSLPISLRHRPPRFGRSFLG